MADANRAPRRVSMAYILGFSNKPFKDGGPPVPAQPPPPRHPSNFKQMVSTPGAVLEWAASDGRRGRLTGPGKSRLTAANLPHASDAKVEVVADKDAGNDDGAMGMMGLFGETAAAPASVKAEEPASSGWTKEQDEKLMELRTDNGPWAATAEELGKKEHECRERFKQVKPADWRPNKGKGGNQKQAKQQGEKNQNNKNNKNSQNNQKGGKNKGGKKDEAANGGTGAPADNAWGNNDNNGATHDTNNGWGGGDNGWGGGGDNKSSNSNTGNDNAGEGFSADQPGWGGGGDSGNDGAWQNDGGDNGGGGVAAGWGDSGDNGGGGGVAAGWGDSGGDSGNTPAWDNAASDNANKDSNDNSGGWGSFGDNNNNNNNNQGFDNNNHNTTTTNAGFDNNTKTNSGDNNKTNNNNDNNPTWGTPAPAPTPTQPNPPSAQHHPPSNSNPNPTPTPQPSSYELTPDSTFSASDLRLIARILQQDAQLVWQRVSWRFRDKTGRALGAEVFERKVVGGRGRG